MSRFNVKISPLIITGQCFKYLKELDSQTDTSKEKQFIFISTKKKHILSNSDGKTTDFLHLKPILSEVYHFQVAAVFCCKNAKFTKVVLQDSHQTQAKKSTHLKGQILGALSNYSSWLL